MELPHDLLYDMLLYADCTHMNSLVRLNKLTNDINKNTDFWSRKHAYFNYHKYNEVVKEHNLQLAMYYKLYNSIKETNDFCITSKYTQIHFLVENYNYVLSKFRIQHQNNSIYQCIYIILLNNKIILRFSEYQIDITKEEFDDILFYIYYTKKQLNILTL
jgi:hypothetical protein